MAQNRKIIIWGAGAVGGTLGAQLARSGADVTLVDTSAEHRAAIRACGLSISGLEGDNEVVVRLPVFHPQEVSGKWPLVVLSVKSQFTGTACDQLASHLYDDGAILNLQNGLGASIVAERLGSERTYLALVGIAADVISPGRIHFGHCIPMPVGHFNGGNTPQLHKLVGQLEGFTPPFFATSDVQSYMWGKHCFNTLLCASAVAASPLASLLATAELRPLWYALGTETLAIAKAQGIEPLPFGPFDPMAFGYGIASPEVTIYLGTMAQMSGSGTKPHSGMWRDIAVHKRLTETRWLIKPMLALGQLHGLLSPMLQATLQMVIDVEENKYPQKDDNLFELLQAV